MLIFLLILFGLTEGRIQYENVFAATAFNEQKCTLFLVCIDPNCLLSLPKLRSIELLEVDGIYSHPPKLSFSITIFDGKSANGARTTVHQLPVKGIVAMSSTAGGDSVATVQRLKVEDFGNILSNPGIQN